VPLRPQPELPHLRRRRRAGTHRHRHLAAGERRAAQRDGQDRGNAPDPGHGHSLPDEPREATESAAVKRGLAIKQTRMGRPRSRGFALVAVMFVMVLLLSVGAALHTSVLSDTAARGGHLRATSGFYAAESGINRGMGEYRDIFLGYNVPTGSDFNPPSFTIEGRNLPHQLANVAGNPFTVVVPAGRLFSGLNATEYRYTANSTSQLHAGDTEASIGTQFNVDYIPIFQFLAFYQGDLEMLPGPIATFHGP